MSKFFPPWTLALLVIFSFLTVWTRLAVVQSTYELNQANKTLNNLKLESEKLELRVAQLRSPRRLEQLARQKFKLQPPTPDRMIPMKK